MSDAEHPEDPKIIVDSDWKAQVKAEKKKLAREQAASAEPVKDEQASDVSSSSGSAQPTEELASAAQSESTGGAVGQELPPASFTMLVTTLATQAAASLGQIPDPIEGKPVVNKAIAKHFIDTLGMLETKTQGNLTEDEKQLLEATLHELRFAFVQTKG